MEKQQEYRTYLDSGQIVRLNLVTKEDHRIWPKELLNQIRRGNLAPFWDQREVRELLEQVLPSDQYPRVVS
jgi:hypothetical protein